MNTCNIIYEELIVQIRCCRSLLEIGPDSLSYNIIQDQMRLSIYSVRNSMLRHFDIMAMYFWTNATDKVVSLTTHAVVK
jgi:hypothetical protein